VTATARSSFAGAPEAPHLAAAGAAMIVMACCLVAVQLHAWQLEQRYVRSLTAAIIPWEHKSRSLVIDRLALSQPDLLPVFGSSELIVGAPHDADDLFKDYPTGFRPFEVASSAATPIIMMMRLASMGTALAGKRIVISITPAEFYRPHLEQPSYKANFSRVQATTLAFDTDIPYSLRRDAARRMLQYPTTIADDPILRWGLEALADRSAFGQARYAAVLPLGLLQGAALAMVVLVRSRCACRPQGRFVDRRSRHHAKAPLILVRFQTPVLREGAWRVGVGRGRSAVGDGVWDCCDTAFSRPRQGTQSSTSTATIPLRPPHRRPEGGPAG